MNDTKQTITEFRVSWTAGHEQYYQGHGIAFTSYTHSGQGCGSTLREAFEDALESLAQQDIDIDATLETELLADLTSQLKESKMLDWTIVEGYCPEAGDHTTTDECETCEGTGQTTSGECEQCEGKGQYEQTDENPDCAVCAGEWHFYVNVDVKVE